MINEIESTDMGLFTLDQFLTTSSSKLVSNAYVLYPGMESLYVRLGPKYIGGTIYRNVLQIANATAITPGAGAFTALLRDLHGRGYMLYAENVLNFRLAAKLRRMGFTQDRVGEVPPSFYLLPNDTLL